MSITLLFPEGSNANKSILSLAPRLSSLNNLKGALLDNSKRNADNLLHSIGRKLESQFGVQMTMWSKGEGQGAGAAAPTSFYSVIGHKTDFAITALGD